MTSALLKNNVPLDAVEIDRDLVAHLRSALPASRISGCIRPMP